MGGLVESGLVLKTVKYCKGVQHNYRLAKNTKKELGTAHHNDASSTGYLITVTLSPINLKGNVFTHASTLTNFTYHEKRIQTSTCK